jgi:hypothetical protein
MTSCFKVKYKKKGLVYKAEYITIKYLNFRYAGATKPAGQN